MPNPRRDHEQAVTAELVRHLFDYDPLTGHLTWRNPQSLRMKVGDRAGGLSSNGRRAVRINYQRFWEHRVIWLHYYGEWPTADVDHEDRSAGHNWIANLRDATHSQNLANQSLNKKNTSGFRGVYRSQRGTWSVDVGFEGKRYRKAGFKTLEAAARHAAELQRTLFGEFTPSYLGAEIGDQSTSLPA